VIVFDKWLKGITGIPLFFLAAEAAGYPNIFNRSALYFSLKKWPFRISY
jgi:hypothetical protein